MCPVCKGSGLRLLWGELMDPYALTILISIGVYLFVGNYAGRKVKHLDDYFVAGRQAPTFIIVGTLVASVVGSNSFLGETEMAFNGYALGLIIASPISVLGYIVGGLFFGRYLRRAEALTVAEFFGRRFNSTRIRRLAAATVIFGLGGYLMTVTQGGALVLSEISDLSYHWSLVVVWGGYSLFTVYAGSRGVVITDTIMFLLFSIVAFVGLYFLLDASGGWFAAIEGLATFEPRPGIIGADGVTGPDASWASVADMWTWFGVVFAFAWGIVFCVSPWQTSRYLMARNEHVVMRSACVAVCVLAVLWPTVQFSGAVIALINPQANEEMQPMIWAALNVMPMLVGALLLAGITSAALSSASTFLTLVGFAITNDLARDSDLSEKRRLLLTRLAIFGVGITALAIALVIPPSIFWITNFVAPMFAACWGPIAFFSVWSKRIDERAAFWGMVAGLAGVIVPRALMMQDLLELPPYLDPILIGATLSTITILVFTRAERITPEERAFREELHVAPPELADAAEQSKTMMLPKIMMAFGVAATTALVVFYIRPFQLARGMTSPEGPFIVMSGEVIAVFCVGIALTAGGAFSLWAMKRFYVETGPQSLPQPDSQR